MPKLDVIVVGAGAAGLAAAQTLHAAGKSVIVLEAQDRIGGRIHSIHTRGSTVEAGAEFIHGEHASTWDIIRANHFETVEWKPSQGEEFELKYAQDGTVQSPPSKEEADALWAAVYEYDGPDISLSEYVATQPYSLEAQESTKGRLARLENAPADALSVLGVAEADRKATNGDTNFWLPRGYDQIPAALSIGLDIRLNCPVVGIEWKQGEVVVRCADGSTFEAARLILTIPLGALTQHLPIFSPAPPTEFIDAISRIGFGNVSKPTFWIEGKIEPFQILATRHPINFWQRDWGEETVLVGFTSYEFAGDLAKLTEDEALKRVIPIVEDTLGKDVVGRIRYARHFEWSQNPYSGGAYSYAKVGMGDARSALRTPIARTIYYAGEATHTEGHAATVHGAMEEGRNAAERILSE